MNLFLILKKIDKSKDKFAAIMKTIHINKEDKNFRDLLHALQDKYPEMVRVRNMPNEDLRSYEE